MDVQAIPGFTGWCVSSARHGSGVIYRPIGGLIGHQIYFVEFILSMRRRHLARQVYICALFTSTFNLTQDLESTSQHPSVVAFGRY